MTKRYERYVRQLNLPGFDEKMQQKLEDSRVAVVGAGGLGSPALLYLAAAGVGHISVIDDDVVELSNLHRQIIHPTANVGVPKVESARDRIQELNPFTDVDIIRGRLTWPEAPAVLHGADIVLDGSDNFDTRHIISATCAQLHIPHVWAAVLGWHAQLSVFHAGHGPVYEDLFPHPPAPGTIPNCAEAGVLGPVVGVVGATMAMETLKFLSGCGECLIGKIGYFDSLTGEWEYLPLTANPQVTERLVTFGPAIGPSVPITYQLPADAQLIDVREPGEFHEEHIPSAINLPLSTIHDHPEQCAEYIRTLADTPVVLYCRSGARSEEAIRILRRHLPENSTPAPALSSFRGGIERWKEGDSSAR
ncbi:molybdopterin biosynthesis protein MoeB [Corynebacterium sp. 3HC-13]|uniref:ThiF family adenylyltransferase n=1 Tax=Corynebacterium poyangense TaxID=2684405 RepID=UPI001CCB8284|nr:ThiF family adenylyltransferase [Corynebacterium poyangense]MBZ8177458.1 molybdopterin biosynthesis protein MoeB [Corynebacterium poyangense]